MRTRAELLDVLAAERQSHLAPLLADDAAPAFAQLRGCELGGLRSRLAQALGAAEATGAERALSPFEGVSVLAEMLPDERAALWEEGCRLIARGELAVLLLAGGQGTRLGSSRPKGCYDIGMPSGKSLFQYHAERLLRVRQLAADAAGVRVSSVRLPLLVMTSDATHAETAAFFEAHARFGLPEEDVRLFEQGMLPCLDADGNALVEGAGRLAMAPDGNGGVYGALERSGLLGELEARGVRGVFQLCVDNALCHVADPTFVAFCARERAECAAKVVPKAHAHERVGVLAALRGRAAVLEYSEIDARTAEAVAAEGGGLLYGAAHICVNWFALPFVARIARDPACALPLHIARKRIRAHAHAAAAPDGAAARLPHAEGEVDGLKLELFIFDAFGFADKMVALQVERDDEFAPVKNAPGAPSDSPDTARALLSAWARRKLEGAGARVGEGEGLVEISPLVTFDGEGARRAARRRRPAQPPLTGFFAPTPRARARWAARRRVARARARAFLRAAVRAALESCCVYSDTRRFCTPSGRERVRHLAPSTIR